MSTVQQKNMLRSRQDMACQKMRLEGHPLLRACLAEFMGTCIMLTLGNGIIAQVILGSNGAHAHGTFLSITVVWGVGVMLGVYTASRNGSGHINPSVTVAFACMGRFPFRRVPFYMLAQHLGAFAGSFIVFCNYYEAIHVHEALHHNGTLTVGPDGTGALFTTFPNHHAGLATCFVDQVIGTAVLMYGAIVIVDKKNFAIPDAAHAPLLGAMVIGVVSAFSYNCGAAINPARDFGPRVMIALCGWGVEAFTYGNYFFWIPIVACHIGAILGAAVYSLIVGIHLTPLPGELTRPSEESVKPTAHDKPNGNTKDFQVILGEMRKSKSDSIQLLNAADEVNTTET